jgi:hypothetical protein
VTSMALLPALAAAGLLLIVSGAAKVYDPRGALEGLGPGAATIVAAAGMRIVGAAEIALGLAVLVSPGRLTLAAVALVYLLFAVVIEWQRRQPGVTSCGCLGRRSAAPSTVHSALNLAFASVAAVAAWQGGSPSLAAAWRESAPLTVAAAAAVLVATALAAAVIRDLPELLSAYQRPASPR